MCVCMGHGERDKETPNGCGVRILKCASCENHFETNVIKANRIFIVPFDDR